VRCAVPAASCAGPYLLALKRLNARNGCAHLLLGLLTLSLCTGVLQLFHGLACHVSHCATSDGPIATRHGAGPIVSPIDVAAATDNRDSLAKTIYSRLFDWLVEKINTSIGQDPNAATMVGVLDIYGASVEQASTQAQSCWRNPNIDPPPCYCAECTDVLHR